MDEALGLERKARVTPKFRELAVELSVGRDVRGPGGTLGPFLGQERGDRGGRSRLGKDGSRVLRQGYISLGLKAPTVCKEAVGNLDEKAAEIGDWLKAKVPALEGPYQSRPFVKYALRQIVLATAGNL